MTIINMVHQGNVSALLLMAVIIAGILAMMAFFYSELKKAHGEKKNDRAVGSGFKQSGNSAGSAAITAAISAAVNEYRKK